MIEHHVRFAHASSSDDDILAVRKTLLSWLFPTEEKEEVGRKLSGWWREMHQLGAGRGVEGWFTVHSCRHFTWVEIELVEIIHE